jgi:hypothetical protein
MCRARRDERKTERVAIESFGVLPPKICDVHSDEHRRRGRTSCAAFAARELLPKLGELLDVAPVWQGGVNGPM